MYLTLLTLIKVMMIAISLVTFLVFSNVLRLWCCFSLSVVLLLDPLQARHFLVSFLYMYSLTLYFRRGLHEAFLMKRNRHGATSSWTPTRQCKDLFDVVTFLEVQIRSISLELKRQVFMLMARLTIFSSMGNTLNQTCFKFGIQVHGERHHHMADKL